MPARPHPIDLPGCTMPAGRADVAELAYALDSKSSGREVMRVQLPPSAPLRPVGMGATRESPDVAWPALAAEPAAPTAATTTSRRNAVEAVSHDVPDRGQPWDGQEADRIARHRGHEFDALHVA
jgi:hypothetical protein